MAAPSFQEQKSLVRAAKFASGMTIAQIAEQEGVSRQAVQQGLAKLGVNRADGGAHKRKLDKRIGYLAKLDEKDLGRWGISHEEKKRLRRNGAIAAFVSQRKAAKNRAIEWRFTFKDWWTIWQESGKWPERGRGHGYCMARLNDEGPYAAGNVSIQRVSENSSDGFLKAMEVGKKYPRGVFCPYPGTSRPFIAKYGREIIVRCATAEEAEEERAKWMRARGL